MINSHNKAIILIIISLFFLNNIISIENVQSQRDFNYKSNSTDDYTYKEYYLGGILLPDTVKPNVPYETGTFPSKWDWRNAEYNGKTGNWMTSVKRQLNCGSCWAFAATAALESIINIRKNLPDLDLDLSEQYLVSCVNNGCWGCRGGNAHSAWRYIYNNGGAILESCFPYEAIDSDGCDMDGCGYDPILCSYKCSDWMDNRIPISEYGYYQSPDESVIKSIIKNNGPVVTTMAVYSDFRPNYKGGIYRHTNGELEGYHQVVINGYDDDENCWICENSWGKNWGEDGYFRIAYGECQIAEQIYYVDFNPDSLNFPPIADAGGIYHGNIENPIYFNGGNTFDLDDNIVLYNWDFGDGVKSNDINPTHTYSQEGIHNVILTVTDEHGEKDIDETAVFIDLWDIDDYWIYNISFIMEPRELYPPINFLCDGSIDRLKFEVSDTSGDMYKLDFNGEIDGSILFSFDLEKIPIDFKLWGSLKKSTIEGSIYITKAGLGLKEIDYNIRGKARLTILPVIPIPIWIPTPFDINIVKTFESPRTLLGIYPNIGKEWNLPSVNSSTEYKFSTLFGLITKTFGNDNIHEKNINFECIDKKTIDIYDDNFETYKILADSSIIESLEYYYAPEIKNVVKFEGSEPDFYDFFGELISTNII